VYVKFILASMYDTRKFFCDLNIGWALKKKEKGLFQNLI
jgi:hypothetical protein